MRRYTYLMSEMTESPRGGWVRLGDLMTWLTEKERIAERLANEAANDGREPLAEHHRARAVALSSVIAMFSQQEMS